MDYYRNVQDLPEQPAKPLYNDLLSHRFTSVGDVAPVTLAEVKEHLLIEDSNADHDDYLADLIDEVVELFEDVLWISLRAKTVEAVIKNEVGNMELPFGPVTTFTNLKDEQDTVIDAGNYDLTTGDFVRLETVYNKVKATYEAGYDATTIPKGLKNALKREIAYRFEHRGDESGTSNSINTREAYKYKRWTWLV